MMRLTIAIFALTGLLVVIVAAALHISAGQVHACSAPALPLEMLIEDAESVFRGQVISIDGMQIKDGVFEDIVEFRATEVWKGDPYETIYVKSIWEVRKGDYTQHPCPPSSHRYTIGARYLVFVHGGVANVGFATSTQHIESSTMYLEELGTGITPTLGTVSPVPVRIELPSDGRSIGGCGFSAGSINLSAIGLTFLLALFWIRPRFRQ